MIKNREFEIDCIRVIGLFCIILAHIPRVPLPIMAFRRFDVPLMVTLSGYLFSKTTLSKKDKNIDILKYFYSRVSRLVYPTWIFLTIFFLGTFVFSNYFSLKFIPFSTIARSYLLIDGIGYVWIIRIYLIVGVLGPFLNKKMQLNKILYSYFAYEIFLIFISSIGINNKLIEVLLITPLLLFIYGVNYCILEKNKNFYLVNRFLGITLFLIGIILYYR
ncbi:MAG: hypothetical protein RR904_03200 [Bacilli bacterium]